MATARSANLKTVCYQVRGTRHENRQEVIRTLRVGSQVSITPDPKNPHDPNAIMVTFRRRQLGWIPKEAAILVHGLEVRKAHIVELGTDEETGAWTHLKIELAYVPQVGTADIIDLTAEEREVYEQMVIKDAKAAEYIASLPREEWKQAIEEWDSSQTTPGDEHEAA